MCNQKRRYLIAEEKDVTTVLTVINRHQGFFSNKDKLAEHCGWPNEPTKWYVRFYASSKEWGRIAKDLSKIGQIYVNVAPGGTTDLYFMRKES